MGKKIVVLSGFKIFPPISGGHLRSGGLAKSLARLGHEVKIYSIAGRQADYRIGDHFTEHRIEQGLHEEIHLGLAVGLIQTVARRLGLPRVWQYALIRSGLISFRMWRMLREADLVICDLPYTPPVLFLEKAKDWWLLSHNLEHRLLEQGSFIEKLCASWMYKIESQAARRYQAILACTGEDKAFFMAQESHQQCRIVQVGNGVDPQLYVDADFERKSLRRSWGLDDEDCLIVFSGSSFQPNLEALAQLREFCRREAAFLRERRIYFLVLGSIQPKPMREGALIMTGKVPDTVPYFAAADAALNPTMRGSGSNLKVLEYLAARLPVISTGFGVRGTKLEAQRDFLLYEGDELKDRLEDLLFKADRKSWKMFAEQVWLRHGSSCDMTALVKQALDGLLQEPPTVKQVI